LEVGGSYDVALPLRFADVVFSRNYSGEKGGLDKTLVFQMTAFFSSMEESEKDSERFKEQSKSII